MIEKKSLRFKLTFTETLFGHCLPKNISIDLQIWPQLVARIDPCKSYLRDNYRGQLCNVIQINQLKKITFSRTQYYIVHST